jgi:hypothetical protein
MKNVFKFFALSALLMCFALFAGSVFAQTSTTGSIEGRSPIQPVLPFRASL